MRFIAREYEQHDEHAASSLSVVTTSCLWKVFQKQAGQKPMARTAEHPEVEY